MFPRRIVRNAIPLSIKLFKVVQYSSIFKPAITHTVEQVPFSSVASLAPRRLYSQEPKVEDLIVDFDHVKNATTNNNIYIIDVRELDEIKEHGKIPNSVHIPLGNVAASLGALPDKEFQSIYNRQKPSDDSEIIFYCMIGKRSGMAQQNAINLGYKNTKNYVGSWNDWASKTH